MDITILLSLLSLCVLGYTTWTNAYEYNTFEDTLTSIGGNEGTIMIASEQAVTDNLIVPANIMLRFIQGGTLNVSVGKTVTINGNVEAPPVEIFIGAGTVVVNTYPQQDAWWGLAQEFNFGVADIIAQNIDQNLLQVSSPTFVTAKLTGLTDGYVPYHIDDATGLANSNIFTDATKVFIGGVSNANMILGLTIDQGAADDEILAFKADEVASPFTDYAEATTYADFQKYSSGFGGLKLRGFTEGNQALSLEGFAFSDNTTKDATAHAVVELVARKTDGGTGAGVVGANANLVTILNDTNGCRFIFDEDGDFYYDGALNNFDEFDDAVACHDVARYLYNVRRPAKEQLTDFIKYNKADLVAMGVISDGDFVSTKGMTALILGAISQLYERNQYLESKIKQLDN